MPGFHRCPACGFDLEALSAVVEACLAVARMQERPVTKIVLQMAPRPKRRRKKPVDPALAPRLE